MVIDDPRSGEYGGTVAAPAFREIAEGALRYLRVDPSLPTKRIAVQQASLGVIPGEEGKSAPRTGSAPQLVGLDARAAIARATAAGYRLYSSGSGIVVSQSEPQPRVLEIVMRPASTVVAAPSATIAQQGSGT